MSKQNTTEKEPLDYSFLLVAYTIYADRLIRTEETRALRQLARKVGVGDRTTDQMEKILEGDSGGLTLEEVARGVPEEQRRETMQKVLDMAYVDGSFVTLEREMIEKVGLIWNWSKEEIEQILSAAERQSKERS